MRLRDSGQLAIALALQREVSSYWRVELEVPVSHPPDRRAADMVLENGRQTILIEIERWIRDFQAKLRAAQLKRMALAERRGTHVRLLLAIPDGPGARQALAPHAAVVRSALPLSQRQAWAALRSGEPLKADALLWVRARELHAEHDQPSALR